VPLTGRLSVAALAVRIGKRVCSLVCKGAALPDASGGFGGLGGEGPGQQLVEARSGIHAAQLLTCLKLSRCRLGFLMNVNVLLLKSAINRVAL
jgi:hypothetical protein